MVPASPYPRLNTIQVQLQDEQWVSTETALVTISIDANLNQTGLDKLQAEVMTTLQGMAKVKWRITRYNRSQDQSGLERVHMQAQARLSESQLNTLRTQAKAKTKPGLKYRVHGIDYSPSQAEMNAVRDQQHQILYKRAKSELDSINKIYSPQKFYLHQITFAGEVPPVSMNDARQYKMAAMPQAAMGSAGAIGGSTQFSKKLTAIANITLGQSIVNH